MELQLTILRIVVVAAFFGLALAILWAELTPEDKDPPPRARSLKSRVSEERRRLWVFKLKLRLAAWLLRRLG